VSFESDKFICVREPGAGGVAGGLVVVDLASGQPLRRPIATDSALMNPSSKVIALKAALPGGGGEQLQVFNLDTKSKVKSHTMPEAVVFWKWLTPSLMGLVTAGAVYHWSTEVRGAGRRGFSEAEASRRGPARAARARLVLAAHAHTARTRGAAVSPPLAHAQLVFPCCPFQGDSLPAKMFDRTASLAGSQIINYRASPDQKWLVLIGIAPGSPEVRSDAEGLAPHADATSAAPRAGEGQHAAVQRGTAAQPGAGRARGRLRDAQGACATCAERACSDVTSPRVARSTLATRRPASSSPLPRRR